MLNRGPAKKKTGAPRGSAWPRRHDQLLAAPRSERYLVVMSHFFAIAFVVAIAILTAVQLISIAVKPSYQQLALRCLYGLSVVVIIVLAAYWLLKTPAATSIS
jgi:hypothetical protein